MAKWVKLGSLSALLILQLSTAGCLSGGVGSGSSLSRLISFFSSLFGGGDSSSVVSSLVDSGAADDTAGFVEGLPDGAQTVQQVIEQTEQQQSARVATLVNPEPASLALFGGGLGALAVWRRRRARKTS